jgi:hypothetical protein
MSTLPSAELCGMNLAVVGKTLDSLNVDLRRTCQVPEIMLVLNFSCSRKSLTLHPAGRSHLLVRLT